MNEKVDRRDMTYHEVDGWTEPGAPCLGEASPKTLAHGRKSLFDIGNLRSLQPALCDLCNVNGDQAA